MVKQGLTCVWRARIDMVDQQPQSSSSIWYGWARTSRANSQLVNCDDVNSAKAGIQDSAYWLPRGAGCSYGDAALSDGGRLLRPQFPSEIVASSNPNSVRVPASMPLGELLARLSLEELTLPVVPGVLAATVGGMVAADVHGKNHQRSGSFGNWVEAIKLMPPDGEYRWCTRESDRELFEGTIGGMGLTGIILEIDLRVVRRSDSLAQVHVEATDSIAQTLDRLEKSSRTADHSSAWLDLALNSPSLGRGVVIGGFLQSVEKETVSQLWEPRSGPVFPPMPVPGESMIRLHNSFYHGFARLLPVVRRWPLEKLLFPLEAWRDWRNVYGKSGFYQHQCLIPESVRVAGLESILKMIKECQISPTLAVLKMMGEGNGGLSFPAPGVTLSLDFRNQAGVLQLLNNLNALVAEFGGRVYLAKDSTLTAGLFQKMYPQLDQFLELRRRIDPGGRIRSDLSSRLGM
ncbi:MAG: hypothetical protein CBC13_11485 [Planctomycetia bacterium TMED53]|nr:MAG: hypothetical protein CBC13_11485 [Planctomycetia bacterium TMED53]